MAPLQRDRSFGSAELWELLRKAGYARPTFLQRKVVPLIHSGRDLAVEVEGDAGKTAAFILPLVARLKRGRAGIKTVVVTSSAEDSRKVEREFQRFLRPGGGRSVAIFSLGAEESDRSEHRSLARQPDVVIGAPNRIIDHIRRGNLEFSLLQSVVVDRKGEDPQFDDDLRFIFSKLPPKKQTILFSPAFDPAAEQLIGLLHRPVLVSQAAWKQAEDQPEELFIEVPESGKAAAVSALALAEAAPALLVLCAGAGTQRRVTQLLAELGLRAQGLREDMSAAEQARIAERFGAGELSILVSTFEAVRRHPLRQATVVINADLPPTADGYRPNSLVLEKLISLGSSGQYRLLQETYKVNPKPAELPSDDQALAGAIRDIVAKVRSEANPQELQRYLRLLRRNAPLAMRSQVAAYLLRSVYGAHFGRTPARGPVPARGPTPERGPAPARGPAPERPAAKERPAQRPAEKPREKPAGLTRLFISAGKSRGIFAKDLAVHFTNTLKIDRSRLGEIRVLDNYSFLEIDSALAEKAIASLSGTQLKGRQITVNYARKREDE
jgi:ATP-dependent RNA helicase DeaD